MKDIKILRLGFISVIKDEQTSGGFFSLEYRPVCISL